MQTPGLPSLVFLAYLLFFLPWAAIRGAQRLRATTTVLKRDAIWLGTLLTQGLLFGLAWLTGRSFDYHIFAAPRLGAREWLAALGALAACFTVRAVLRAGRAIEERRKLTVFRVAPRTPREWVLWTAVVLAASVTEEAAYRGVGMSILWYSLGNPWVSALICALAFALAHWTQGLRSGAAIFAIALVMHGLVAFTGTLILAMIVHAVYDLVAGTLIAREAVSAPLSLSSEPSPEAR